MKNRLLLCVIVLFQISVFGQNINKEIRKGVNLYKDSSFVNAEKKFGEALLKDQDSFIPSFNLADAVYKQNDFERSASLFKGLTKKAKNKKQKSMAYHNLGNSLYNQNKIEESIEAYKNALRNNPDDQDSKYNLALAKKLLKKEEEKEEQEEEQEEQEQEEEEEQEEEQENEENSQQNQEAEDQQKPEKPDDPNEMTQEEAEQMLNALENKERELQEELQKKKGKAVNLKIEKDW